MLPPLSYVYIVVVPALESFSLTNCSNSSYLYVTDEPSLDSIDIILSFSSYLYVKLSPLIFLTS